MNREALEALEKEIEHTLFQLMDLEAEENIIEMGEVFRKLLMKLEHHGLINRAVEVIVDLQQMQPETKLLLESLTEARAKKRRKLKLITHRDIIKIWLRKNKTFRQEYLPMFF